MMFKSNTSHISFFSNFSLKNSTFMATPAVIQITYNLFYLFYSSSSSFLIFLFLFFLL